MVTRRSTKKRKATVLSDEQADALKTVRNDSPQAWRDVLLMCLLLDHGLRASEVALLKASNIDIRVGEMTFYRPKIKGTEHEWTTHKLTAQTREVASYLYMDAPSPSPTGRGATDSGHDPAAKKRRRRAIVGRRVESGTNQ